MLKARAAQARQAVLLEGALPGPALLLGQLVALQRLFEGDAAGAQRTYSAGIRPKTFRQPVSRSAIACCTATAQRTASTTLKHFLWRPKPWFLLIDCVF